MLLAAHLGHYVTEGHSCSSAAPRHRRPPRRLCRGRACPRTARQPYRGAPARSRRRCAALRPPWPRPAARRARTRRPPSAPRGGAHRCTAQAAPAPGAECAPISGTGGRSRSAAGKSARRRLCGRAHAGEGGDDLVQRGLGRPGACPALGGAAGRPSALAERPNSRKIAAAESSRRQPRSTRCTERD